MKISIIMPIYNSEKTLNRSIKSLLNQKYKNLEIILINDGSTDTSLDICEKYQEKDSRIKIFTIENSGPSVARNRGLEYADGEYTYFMDADDFINDNMFIEIRELIYSYFPDVIIFGNNNLFDNGYKLKKISENSYPFKIYLTIDEFKKDFAHLQKSNYINPVWNKLYKTKIIKKNNIRFNPEIITEEDLLFNLEIFRKSQKIIVSNKKFYNYISDSKTESLTSKFIPDKIEQKKNVLSYKKQFYKEWDREDLLNREFNKFITNLSVYINNMFYNKKELHYEEKLKYVDEIISDEKIIEIINKTKIKNLRNLFISFLVKHKLKKPLLLTGKISQIKRIFEKKWRNISWLK